MKSKRIALIMSALALTATAGFIFGQYDAEKIQTAQIENVQYSITFPNLRTAEGIYHDYLTVETTDGNLWSMGEDSRYLDSEGNAIFTEGEKVIVLFDMWGEETEDDFILDVHSLEY